ncbi:TRAP transporter substrate-binding protein DctP [Paracoccus sediminicola]|uniref:TRAP transporter substrate-binding protein DctP n=1 Tax=Paracoccus sediminicola TaxID=3017783 RepID=UPI0022F07515|nr:TRAP transporter substrate-binding protein DctP [Paracoccus sediminicola]WBU57396.1 TRAP transporter substrate-binding protein DctP [Paracoccus sediminicola]
MKYRITAGLLGSTAFGAAQAQDQSYEWTLAYLSVKGTIYEEVALAIPDRIAEATDGQVQITATSSLVAGDRLLESVRDGLVQLSMPLTGYYTGTQPMFTVPSLPGYSESYDDLLALSQSDYGDQLRAIYTEDYNATEILETAFCPQTLFSTKPITTLEEWEGRKLRVNNRGTGLIGDALGAITVSLSAAEVLPALERGVIDGVITDTCWAYGAGFGSVITHAADWQLGKVVPSPVLVNNDAWGELPEELRAKISDEFDRIEADFAQRWRERTEELPELWAEAGVEYTVVSDEENARFNAEELQSKVIEAWREDMQRAGLDADSVLATARAALE